MKTIKEIMTASPTSCKESDSLKKIAQLMDSLNIGSLPVVDQNDKVLGMITDRDICILAGSVEKGLEQLKVRDAMSASIETINADEDTTAALKLMRTKQIGRLPVVDAEKKLKGIITLNGIVRGVRGTSDKEEIEYKGKENVISTLEAIAERNTLESVDDFGEE
jgi:CBS domain-containing protein